jgi:hypothetical protein
MPLRWKIFRAICVVQLLFASLNMLQSLFYLFLYFSFRSIAGLMLFTAIMFLCILGINLVNNNYPDEPVQGNQKKNFNRLFLLNFLSLAFLFGFIIAEFNSLKQFAGTATLTFFQLPFTAYIMLINYLLILIFQLCILYGLFRLRLELYSNFMNKKFEFEKS